MFRYMPMSRASSSSSLATRQRSPSLSSRFSLSSSPGPSGAWGWQNDNRPISSPQGNEARLPLPHRGVARRHLRISDLLAVRHFLQDAKRDLRFSAGVVSEEHPVQLLCVAV